MSNKNKKDMDKKTLTFKKIPVVIHPFNDHVENFININGVTLQNVPLSKLEKELVSMSGKQILFDFLQAFRPWNDEETEKVDRILSAYKNLCEKNKRFNTQCLFIGNPERIREVMKITQCPSKMIMLAETLESAALMTTLSAN